MRKRIRIILFISILTICLFISGCVHRVKIPIGERPTEKFTVVEYIQDDAIFQAASSLKISGKSNSGVVIVATLYDSKNLMVNQVYCNTDNNGNWNLNLDTPDATMKSYTLKIYDSAEVYHETFTNIRFGEVWMIIGDEFKNIEIPKKDENIEEQKTISSLDGPIDYMLMFYQNNQWLPAQFELSNFGYQLINQIKSTFNTWNRHPIAIVFATSNDTNIYQWLSREIIESRKVIKDYLVSEGLYTDATNLVENGMSYLFEKYLNNLRGMSYANIIINQGLADLNDANNGSHYTKDNFSNVYSQMLYTFLSELDVKFLIENKIFYIQEGTDTIENSNILRKIQSSTCNYYNKCEIIPTYDLALIYDRINDRYLESDEIDLDNISELDILGIDYLRLSKRIYQFSINSYSAPTLKNTVKEYENNGSVVRIKLIFENVNIFDNYETINGLKFYDLEGNEVELEYTIDHNEIIINLLKIEKVDEKSDVLLDRMETILEEKKYIELSKICYAQESFIYGNNLSSDRIGVIPFEVILVNK